MSKMSEDRIRSRWDRRIERGPRVRSSGWVSRIIEEKLKSTDDDYVRIPKIEPLPPPPPPPPMEMPTDDDVFILQVGSGRHRLDCIWRIGCNTFMRMYNVSLLINGMGTSMFRWHNTLEEARKDLDEVRACHGAARKEESEPELERMIEIAA